MKFNWAIYSVLGTAAIFCSCVKPYSPAVTTVNVNVLVVEGFINTGGDTTKIKLSHTVTIGSKTSSVAESGATVTVEDAAGTSYAVPETTTKGSYASKGALIITSGKQYRLRIKTGGGKTYLSDLVDAKATPPIDSIGYTLKSDGMQLYVNAHDNANQSLYYKYGFSEAWIFHAKYSSQYISNGVNDGVARSIAQDIFFCYGVDSSANVIINSTAALSKDVVYQFPVNNLSDTSEKLESRYSILVSQQTLTKEAYTFWENLKKNTEQLGSIFDAQPSAISGNIHDVSNTAAPVIGYISAGSIQKKRIYINKNSLPANYVAGYPFSCTTYDAQDPTPVPIPPPAAYFWAYYGVILQPSPNRIISELGSGVYESMVVASANCADCTIRGTHNPPIFWKP